MLPTLNMGDLIALQGISNASQIKAPVVDVTPSEWNSTMADMQDEFTACILYNSTSGRIDQYMRPGDVVALDQEQLGKGIGRVVANSSQSGLIRYDCGLQNVSTSAGIQQEAYTKYVVVNGTVIRENLNNSIVVYQTTPKDLFYMEGDEYIVHRAYAVIDAGGSYYVLTKGDNNPGLDIQYANYPPNLSSIKGKVVASIPYIGFLKLALSNQIATPAGCNSTVIH
jgi:signal peptidase I